MIRGVHHTSLSTRNFDAMLHFYRDLLGLPFVISYDWSIGSTASDKCVGLKDSAAKTRKASNDTRPFNQDAIDGIEIKWRVIRPSMRLTNSAARRTGT